MREVSIIRSCHGRLCRRALLAASRSLATRSLGVSEGLGLLKSSSLLVNGFGRPELSGGSFELANGPVEVKWVGGGFAADLSVASGVNLGGFGMAVVIDRIVVLRKIYCPGSL